ncbi:MAG: DUF5721 family protein [Blautia sp.]|nr:DUF5721 family protein [Blautia sp.]
MLALALTDTKEFMNKLLKSELFDHFLLQEGTVTAGATCTIDGRINRDFYSGQELTELALTDCRFLPFSMLRGNFFDLIKGKKAPSSFKFIFLLSPKNLARTLESISSAFSPQDITGIFLNLRYQSGQITLTTGVSYAVFSADKTLEREWDRMVKQFLKKHDISYEEL